MKVRCRLQGPRTENDFEARSPVIPPYNFDTTVPGIFKYAYKQIRLASIQKETILDDEMLPENSFFGKDCREDIFRVKSPHLDYIMANTTRITNLSLQTLVVGKNKHWEELGDTTEGY